ncbi:hypothetical protein BCR43DRAFT_503463 [Syncephalastrum racemosum]|uniref:WW domain-containing protein n=1 Tax=Syncephalastrum racemosum TaxID=13706 RepID=A0A1X2HJ76_SYNRA|nr:hypothetical protein BCR43DRAFT_503463 [Syncephalastrum racemosum]
MNAATSGPYPPPNVPDGWTACWDASAQRYYFVEMATGRSQWEVPQGASAPGGFGMPSSDNTAHTGEASSYLGGGAGGGATNSPAVSSYPDYQQQQQQQQQQVQPGQETGERGLGSMVSGLMGKQHHYGQSSSSGSKLPFGPAGGAIGGALLGFAAGKLMNNHHSHHQQQQQQGYYPPPQVITITIMAIMVITVAACYSHGRVRRKHILIYPGPDRHDFTIFPDL